MSTSRCVLGVCFEQLQHPINLRLGNPQQAVADFIAPATGFLRGTTDLAAAKKIATICKDYRNAPMLVGNCREPILDVQVREHMQACLSIQVDVATAGPCCSCSTAGNQQQRAAFPCRRG